MSLDEFVYCVTFPLTMTKPTYPLYVVLDIFFNTSALSTSCRIFQKLIFLLKHCGRDYEECDVVVDENPQKEDLRKWHRDVSQIK